LSQYCVVWNINDILYEIKATYSLPFLILGTEIIGETILIGDETNLFQNFSIHSHIDGYWIEDDSKRMNIDLFLSRIGVNDWFQKKSHNDTLRHINNNDNQEWKIEKIIILDEDYFQVSEVRGGNYQPHEFKVKLDNRTMSNIDIGEFASLHATAEMTEKGIICYFMKPGEISSGIFFTITHMLAFPGISRLKIESRHVESGVTWTSIFKRQ